MSDWIKHDGNGIPVDPETRVAVLFADGWCDEEHEDHPKAWYWTDGTDSPEGSAWYRSEDKTEKEIITHYKVVEK